MRRFFVLLFLGVAGAFGIWYGMRGNATKASTDKVTALLPNETLAFVHVPDFNRSYAQWQQTDIHKLWREPAVQEFLQKPMTKVPAAESVREKLREFRTLEMMDGFLAITSWDKQQLKMLGGFRFEGSAADAEKVIGSWRMRVQENVPDALRETLSHGEDEIEVVTRGAITVATAYSGDWFLAANDVEALKLLLDRANHRNSDATTTLASDETFLAAFKHLPAVYAAAAYARVDGYFERFTASFPQGAEGNEHLARLRQVKSVAAATRFEEGKIRDVMFVGMPKMHEPADLKRSSLILATADSFFYSASMLAFSTPALVVPSTAATGLPAVLQRFAAAFTAQGIPFADWGNAFGPELGLIGEWPENARLPGLFATLQVKDSARARQIATAITSASPEREWTISEKEGVEYLSLPPANPMVPFAPTIALGNQIAIVGLDVASVEAGMKRALGKSSGLGGTQKFKVAERIVPEAAQSFTYLDAALLYQRLDAALRPMLVMAAAFMPGIADTVDLGKLPPAEAITKHLGPLVVSQGYYGDGYVTESVGPLSIYQVALGVAGASGVGAAFYHKQMKAGAEAPRTPAAAPLAIPKEVPEEPQASPSPETTP